MAEAGAERLAAQRLEPVLLPAIAYTPAEFAAAFPGTLTTTADALVGLVERVARDLAQHDFGILAIANAHLDPAHLAALDRAVAVIRDGSSIAVAWPNLTRRPWALRLTEEFQSGACHAGQFETSILLARRPDLVREQVRSTLDPNPSSLSVAIRAGKTSFAEAGGPRAYFGFPRDATAAEGHQTIELLGEILADAVAAERGTAHVA
jgi:creatinine amidohydrolase